MNGVTSLKNSTGYIPALDGFRGLAILVVVISHYGYGNLIPGGFGVTLFFFISGFLITRLMINEQRKEGRIDLKNFYIRRLLRLYPALLLMTAVASMYVLAIDCNFRPGELLSTLFYYRNYYMVYFRGDVAVQCTKVFDIVWSLAIEEHFYIVFPLVFIAFCKRPGQLIWLMVAGIVAVLAWRVYLATTQGMNAFTIYKIYHLTETRADAIMYGCLVSFILDSRRGSDYLRFAGHKFTFAVSIALLLFTFLYRDATFRETYRYSIQGISMSLFVPAILYSRHYTGVLSFLNTAWLTAIGRLSYSIYMFHWLGVCVAEYLISTERRSLPWLLTALPLGLALSLLSYHFVEKPTNKLRKRFGSNVQTTNLVDVARDRDIKPVTVL